MSGHRIRGVSPPRRIYVDAPRASTGTILPSSFDTGFNQQPRSSFSAAPAARNSTYETQPVRKSTYADQSHPGGTISKTEYAVRPRRNSQLPETRRPLSLVSKNPSPTRNRPVLGSSPREIASVSTNQTPRNESSRFLQPAASHNRYPQQSQRHQRHNSATRAETDRYQNSNRESRQKEYHRTGPHVEKIYSATRPQPRLTEDDGYSYTGPREQFARDYPDRPPQRKDSHSRRERPTSVVDFPEVKQLPPSRRENGPPPAAARQLERIEHVDARGYRAGFESDPDRPVDSSRRRNSTRNPVLHQQRDDGYSSSRDELDSRRSSRLREERYDDNAVGPERHRDINRDFERDRGYKKNHDRERERDRERPREERPREHDRNDRDNETRRKPRSREGSPERSSLKGLAAAAGLGGLATAALAQREPRRQDTESEAEDVRGGRRKKHRHRDRREEDAVTTDVPDDRDTWSKDGGRRDRHKDGSSSDTPDDQPPRRRRSRHRSRRDKESIEYQSDRDLAQPLPEKRPLRSEPRDREFDTVDNERQRRDRAAESGPEEEQKDAETRTISPGENEDDRPRRVQLVEPVKDKDEVKPRGILKPPRAVPFPEDPNPTREGVAPLKEAGKDGVPSGARWTKISRMLVNPEALERYHERFEERDEYVIVLRVLTREEIQKFAEKTKEIREKRERAWQEELEERRRHKAEPRQSDDELQTDDEKEERQPRMIEQQPAVPPTDLRSFMAQNNGSDRVGAGLPGAMPVPDIDLNTLNYSQNV